MTFDRKGEITVSKLIAIILAVVILIFSVIMVSRGITPNVEKIGARFDEVISFLQFWKEDFFTECYLDDVSGFVDGSSFLESVGLVDADVKIGRCNDGSCNMSVNGVEMYRVTPKGVFQSFSGYWLAEGKVFDGDFDVVKKYWGIYNAVRKKCEDVGVDEIYNKKFSDVFVAYRKKKGVFGFSHYAIWENGEWTVGEVGIDKVPKRGTNIDILNEFLDGTYSGSDDKIYWKILPSEKIDGKGGAIVNTADDVERVNNIIKTLENYNSISDKGEVRESIPLGLEMSELVASTDPLQRDLNHPENLEPVGTLIGDKKANTDDIDDILYNALACAEHRSDGCNKKGEWDSGYNPWIRTKDRKCVKQKNGHCYFSSAYGPVQITYSLASTFLEDKSMDWTEEEKDYLKRYLAQGKAFLTYSKWRSGLDSNVYGFGGTGTLTSPSDKAMYEQVAKKMIKKIYEENDENPEAIWREWRFGKGDMWKKEDSGYEDFFNSVRFVGESASYEKQSGDFDEIDNEAEMSSFKLRVGDIIKEMSSNIKFKEEDLADFGEKIGGQTILVNGKEYVLSLNSELSNTRPYINVDGGIDDAGVREYFTLGYEPNLNKVSKNIFLYKLRTDFPFEFVSSCCRRGYLFRKDFPKIYNDYSRLSEDNFNEVKLSILASNFLRSVCR